MNGRDGGKSVSCAVPMITADEALRLVLGNVAALGVERVPLLNALGRVLAEDIRAPRDIPPFDNSAMDGYAVLARDLASASESAPVRLQVLETVGAGTMPTRTVRPGTAVRTMTGAPIAAGADAVVQVERTRAAGDAVEVLAPVAAGTSIRPRGEDVRSGDLVISAGSELSPPDIGMLASINRSMVDVWRRPRAAIVCTGDELVDIDQIPAGAQIVNSSAYALAAAIIEAGGEPTILKVARDTEAEIRERLTEALRFDVVFSTGGVSVGQFDHVKGVLDDLGLRTIFHGVAQKPGRPLKFGVAGGCPVFGLPGNPVSTLVCFYLYAVPALAKMSGRSRIGLPRVGVACAEDIKAAKNLTEFVRVRLERRDGKLYASTTGNQGSGILSSVSRADALLIAPASETMLKAESSAEALLLHPYATMLCLPFFEERRFQKN